LDEAFTTTDLPCFTFLIMQEVFIPCIVQVRPLAETLLPVIFDPPFRVGSDIETVMVTLPFLGAEKLIEVMAGADGLEIAA
jgi:hypothetical protein